MRSFFLSRTFFFQTQPKFEPKSEPKPEPQPKSEPKINPNWNQTRYLVHDIVTLPEGNQPEPKPEPELEPEHYKTN